MVLGTNLSVAGINTSTGSVGHRARNNIRWDVAIPLATLAF